MRCDYITDTVQGLTVLIIFGAVAAASGACGSERHAHSALFTLGNYKTTVATVA
jgi:hypothetical protein